MSSMNQFKETFKEEAYELLGSLEDLLMDLEDDPKNPDAISAVFRAIHTIKGSASMFDFNGIASFSHVVETVLDGVREGEVNVTKKLIDLTLLSRDHILSMLNAEDDSTPEFEAVSQDIVLKMKKLTVDTIDAETVKIQEKNTADDETKKTVSIYRIQFAPDENIFLSGTNLLSLLNELRQMGEFACICYNDDIPEFDFFNPELCYVKWDIYLTTKHSINDVKDVFIFLDSRSKINVALISDWQNMLADDSNPKLGEILVEKGLIKSSDLDTILDSRKKIGELLIEKGMVSTSDVKSALEEQKVSNSIKQNLNSGSTSSIRVKSEKLDSLVDSVGELVTAQARLSQLAAQEKSATLISLAEQIERLTSDLRDNTMSLRMIPIGTTFSRFKRLVRDLSSSLNKNIQLVTRGGDTELDKNVIEKLNDPLIHLIRNSIDHGIESPDEREKSGKEGTGTITLDAHYTGANVQLQIRDDGHGLNKEAILKKAIKKNLIPQDALLSDEEIYNLIFLPGFSTAQSVTSVSGRGVGMDVVRKQIDALNGSIYIKSESGKGTEFSLHLPFTLAIIEGLLVSIGDEKYIFPLSMVQACMELSSEERNSHGKKRLTEFRDSVIPYIRLRELFVYDGELPDREHLVVIQTENNLTGFVVDEVIGDHQTVIKNMGKLYKSINYITGATILGDGNIALILDVNRLAILARKEN
ncbi:chemotaxis protein CheA [Oceanispirochaeta sp.]|jgi:two-component system chemotaxis sensor kinase CheA|uniref:chemotaxis protein CheA n=1 Tax=Oceanispirochaeta sp. TaxID=2035350 RepID=UPI00260BA9A7|nr:chemotaxis protein CheA [Oceanispirochaeta sp.]MDA3955887.1 chemotaxis protein CheA [Oceanispirochaeta sp.]